MMLLVVNVVHFARWRTLERIGDVVLSTDFRQYCEAVGVGDVKGGNTVIRGTHKTSTKPTIDD
jgi:hypothetical protein